MQRLGGPLSAHLCVAKALSPLCWRTPVARPRLGRGFDCRIIRNISIPMGDLRTLMAQIPALEASPDCTLGRLAGWGQEILRETRLFAHQTANWEVSYCSAVM